MQFSIFNCKYRVPINVFFNFVLLKTLKATIINIISLKFKVTIHWCDKLKWYFIWSYIVCDCLLEFLANVYLSFWGKVKNLFSIFKAFKSLQDLVNTMCDRYILTLKLMSLFKVFFFIYNTKMKKKWLQSIKFKYNSLFLFYFFQYETVNFFTFL